MVPPDLLEAVDRQQVRRTDPPSRLAVRPDVEHPERLPARLLRLEEPDRAVRREEHRVDHLVPQHRSADEVPVHAVQVDRGEHGQQHQRTARAQ